MALSWFKPKPPERLSMEQIRGVVRCVADYLADSGEKQRRRVPPRKQVEAIANAAAQKFCGKLLGPVTVSGYDGEIVEPKELCDWLETQFPDRMIRMLDDEEWRRSLAEAPTSTDPHVSYRTHYGPFFSR